LLNLQGQIPPVLARDTAAGDEIKQTLFVQLCRPANRDFKARPNGKFMIGGKQHPRTADIQRLPRPLNDLCPLAQRLVSDLPFNRKAAGSPSFDVIIGS
jgi:hypothetical protein